MMRLLCALETKILLICNFETLNVKWNLFLQKRRNNPLIALRRLDESDAPLNGVSSVLGYRFESLEIKFHRQTRDSTYKLFLLYPVKFAEETTVDAYPHDFHETFADFLSFKDENQVEGIQGLRLSDYDLKGSKFRILQDLFFRLQQELSLSFLLIFLSSLFLFFFLNLQFFFFLFLQAFFLGFFL